jgi:aralkylamine N-acetyltransferase
VSDPGPMGHPTKSQPSLLCCSIGSPARQTMPTQQACSAAAALRSRRPSPASTTTTSRQLRLRPPRAATAGVRLTVSDAELESRGFAVRRTAEGIDVAALNEVFVRVGFPRRQEERLRRALEHSRVVWLSAGEEEGRPVAFARAAGDGVFNAVVWDVVVEPSSQGLGLGRAVMERLVDELRRDGVANIVLYAETRVVGFYRLLDFAMDPDGIRGMAYYRKSTTTAA